MTNSRISDMKEALSSGRLTLDSVHIAELHKAGEAAFLEKHDAAAYARWLGRQAPDMGVKDIGDRELHPTLKQMLQAPPPEEPERSSEYT